MSYDFKLRNPCDHRVRKEEVFLEADNRTLLIPRVVVNKNQFQLFVNGLLVSTDDSVFSYTLRIRHKPDETYSFGTDAFIFKPDHEYVLREKDISINSLSFADFLSISGRYTSNIYFQNHPSEFSSGESSPLYLSNSNFEVYLDTDSKTHVICRESSSIMEGTWILVGYEFLSTFVESSNYNQYEVVFDRSLVDSYTFEVSYATDSANCRKCIGLEYHNDLALNSVGSYETVEKTNKLLQDAFIFTFTSKGSDPHYPQLGTYLLNMIGKKYLGVQSDISIQVEVKDTLLMLQKLQRDQSTIQELSDEEFLKAFKKAEVTQDEDDFTKFYVKIRMSSLSENDLEVSSVARFTRVV